MRYTIALTIILLTPIALNGDVLHLKDGRTLEGDVKRSPDGWVVVSKGETVTVSSDEVKSIEVGAGAKTEDAGLFSLRRSVASTTDAKSAIDKYERFIATNKDAPVAEVARADLRIWQDRLDRKLVKLGDKWVTPAEVEQAKAKYAEQLIEARDLLLAGKAKEAEAIVGKVLAGEPQEPAALYLRGILAFASGDMPAARKAFDASLAAQEHGPTMNNVAVVMMRQNQAPAALNMYGRALAASPGDPRVLDNVAEALNASAPDNKLNGPVKKLTGIFSPLDIAMAQQRASEGLYRWGATWVAKHDLDRLQAIERQVNEQLLEYEREFASLQSRLRGYDEEISANDRAMRRIEANSMLRDEQGRLIRTVLPPSYYQLQRDNDELAAAKQRAQTDIERLRVTARDVRAKLPTPRYTGAQRLIGPEGTPNLPAPAPATQPVPAIQLGPATQPASVPATSGPSPGTPGEAR
jgi:tetratricopeptide (TPR) repeat protein